MRPNIKHLLTPKFFLALAILSTVTILVGSMVTVDLQPDLEIKISDKFMHAIAYFFLSSLWFLALLPQRGYTLKNVSLIALLVFFYGIIIEVLQGAFTHTREADLYDILANFVGVVIAGVLTLVFIKSKITPKAKK